MTGSVRCAKPSLDNCRRMMPIGVPVAGRLAQVALAVRRPATPARMPVYIIRRVDRPFGPAASGLCHMLGDDFRASGRAAK